MRGKKNSNKLLAVEYWKPGLGERLGSWILRGGYDTPYRYGLPVSYSSAPFRILGELLQLQGSVDRDGFEAILRPHRRRWCRRRH
jgi:uncharacterized protein (DUF3820 family)